MIGLLEAHLEMNYVLVFLELYFMGVRNVFFALKWGALNLHLVACSFLPLTYLYFYTNLSHIECNIAPLFVRASTPKQV